VPSSNPFTSIDFTSQEARNHGQDITANQNASIESLCLYSMISFKCYRSFCSNLSRICPHIVQHTTRTPVW
jgi:hypothetical protein